MLLEYRSPRITTVWSDGLYARHRFKSLGKHNLCSLSIGAFAHRRYT